MNFEHLTDEQFAELLAGEANTRARTHVESCAVCFEELRSVGAAVGDLNHASLRWAERRAERIERPSVWALNWSALPGWGATLAGVLILGVALGAHMQSNDERAMVMQPAHIAAVAPSEDELAQDNRLLRSIDDELNEQPQVSMEDSGSASRTAHRRATDEVSN